MRTRTAVFVELVIVTLVLAEPPTCSPQFKCFDQEPFIYEIWGAKFACPPSQICNNDHLSTDCTPCVNLSADVCKFTCTGDTSGIFHVRADQPFECGPFEVCNAAYMDSCKPCIPRVCERFYKCNTSNPREVAVNGEILTCPADKVCNKEYQIPCSMCITDASPITETTTTTTTTSIATIKTTITEQPFEPPTKYPPYCNDGYSATHPCRPGPKKSGYYYHCRQTIANVYDYEIKLCKTLYADGACRGAANLCPV